MTRILVVASTFPAHDADSVPAFVRDQIIAMKTVEPSLEFSVLAPHDIRSGTKNFTKQADYDEYRFHYAWPGSIEKLAGRGIMPALQANPFNYLLIPALFVAEFLALYRLALKLKPDIIYAHWFTPQAVTARLAGALTRRPFVFTTHASDVSVWHKIPVIGTFVVRSNIRKSHAFTAVSRRSMEKLAAFFAPDEWADIKTRSRIIPMGVELPEHRSGTSQSASPQSLLFVGRLAEKKGVHYLLPAFSRLTDRYPKATLTIAGDGPWLSKLKAQASELGLSDANISFAGYVSGNEKQALIDSHEIYVVPSIITAAGDAEGLPVSLMEGLANGKLCVATNESGADDILSHTKDGFLVPQQDIDALCDTLQSCLELTKEQRSDMAKLARRTAKQFSWDTIARQHISFLFKESS